MDHAKASNSPSQAIEVVELASAFSLPSCESLTQRVMTDFAINLQQKEALGNLTALTSDSDTDSSSDSDSDTSEGKWKWRFRSSNGLTIAAGITPEN